MKPRKIEEMDEKDWIIVRLLSLFLRVNGFGIMRLPEVQRMMRWAGKNLWVMTREASDQPNDPYVTIVEEHLRQIAETNLSPPLSVIAEWPYAIPEEPLPPECAVTSAMEAQR